MNTTEKAAAAFTDVSMFQGIIEFSDENGAQYRCEGRKLSKLTRGSWIHLGVTPGAKILKTPRAIFAVIDSLED